MAVTDPTSWRMRQLNRVHARIAAMGSAPTSFAVRSEPRSIGSFARGRHLLAGHLMFAGHLVNLPVDQSGTTVWTVAMPSAAFTAELHGFAWLDDLAAVGNAAARSRAQGWTFDWIARFGNGSGDGWLPDLTGRRMVRWINHAGLLLQGATDDQRDAYFRSLVAQTQFLARRWKAAAVGLPRIEALCGLICAGLSLEGASGRVDPAKAALARECALRIDADGGIPSRNPEELLEVFTLLTWAATALAQGGQMALRPHLDAIARTAPTLRMLRHADGGLARFHGGGRGADGRLDHALAASGVKPAAQTGLAMGYARLHAGRISVIVDASPPPQGPAAARAHASTLAFEMTSGRRPLIVNCGPGALFGDDWHRGGRATPSQSTLSLDGYSSSRFGTGSNADMLVDAPRKVRAQHQTSADGQRLIVGHDGYSMTHGLTHVRELMLAADGRNLRGIDTLGAMTGAERRRLDRVLARDEDGALGFSVRFHLHPDVDSGLDMGGSAVSLALRSGEVWVFRSDGVGTMTLEPSVHLERGRLAPRASAQIVISAVLADHAAQVGWTLAKAQGTPTTLRDLDQDDPLTAD